MNKLALLFTLVLSSASAYGLTSEEAYKRFEESVRRGTLQATAISANSSDGILCLNAEAHSVEEERALAKDCFVNARLAKLVQENPWAFTASQDIKKEFVRRCSAYRECDEKDLVFGGRHTSCEPLGIYIDYLHRIRGFSKEAFSIADGQELCKRAVDLR